MKKIVLISLFVFWALVTAVLTAGLVSYEKNKSAGNGTPADLARASVGAGGAVLSVAELAKHNSGSDCWLLVSGKLYNVTSYISSHPGGAGAITSYCGREATVAFQTKGGQGSHSQNANNILAAYYIGDLNQSVTQQQLNSAVSQTNVTQPPAGGGGEYEEEFEDD